MTTLREVRSRMQAMLGYIAALNGLDNALRGFEEGEVRDAARKLGAALVPGRRLQVASALKAAIKAIDDADNSDAANQVTRTLRAVQSELPSPSLWDGIPDSAPPPACYAVAPQNCGQCGARLYDTARTSRAVYVLTPANHHRYLITGTGGLVVANDGDCDGPPLLFREPRDVQCAQCSQTVSMAWAKSEFFE